MKLAGLLSHIEKYWVGPMPEDSRDQHIFLEPSTAGLRVSRSALAISRPESAETHSVGEICWETPLESFDSDTNQES
jgi:hypothetical protein